MRLMGVQNSEVGYTTAMLRREDHEVHKDIGWQWTKKTIQFVFANTNWIVNTVT